jgi:SAM-dependent methyltransferase
MERVFQLARALTLENISDLDQWKYEFRHEANNLRTELAKSLHTPTKRTHRRVRHVSLEEMHHARRRIINRNAQSGSAIGQDITDYEAEATYVYGLVERRGLQCWSQLFEPCDYNAFPGRSFWEAILNSHTAYFRNASVFEYGCGTGPLTNLLSGYVSSILATDINFTALRLAKHLCKAGNVRFEHLDFAKSQPCSKSFDVVVDNYVTQQIVDEAARDRLFSNVNRFLSPSGLYIFVVVISATEQDEISRLPLSDGLYSQRLHRTLSALRNELKRHQLCEVNAYSEGTRCCIVAKKHGPGTASP